MTQGIDSELKLTTRARPPLRYHGSKWRLAPWILSFGSTIPRGYPQIRRKRLRSRADKRSSPPTGVDLEKVRRKSAALILPQFALR